MDEYVLLIPLKTFLTKYNFTYRLQDYYLFSNKVKE